MTITAEQLVQREINCCLSSLVSILAKEANNNGSRGDLASLCLQAEELAMPIADYIEAAIQAGWDRVHDGGTEDIWRKGDVTYDSLDELMEGENLDPYEREVFEHWAVSQWLAEKLIEAGEKVDTDFAGLNVWARTCTGQAISMDGCIQQIHAALVAS